MVILKNVGKWYHYQEKVLDTLHLQLKQGDFLYVLGGSGVGKSTLLRMIAAEENSSQGHIELFGFNIDTANEVTLKAIRRSIGYIPQDLKLIPDLSVLDNILLSLKISGKKNLYSHSNNTIHELLDKLGLAHKKNYPCEKLSGGEAQRVAFIRALVRNPELIIADEPTGAQDRDFTWIMMDELIKANKNGATVLMATHDQEIIKRVPKKCVILKSGKIQLEERYYSL